MSKIMKKCNCAELAIINLAYCIKAYYPLNSLQGLDLLNSDSAFYYLQGKKENMSQLWVLLCGKHIADFKKY